MTGPRTWRCWISLCAALVVLAELGGILHLGLASHGVCWEHGVMVELDAHGAESGPSTAEGVDALPAQARRAGPASRLGVAPAGFGRADHHLHCPALWVHQQTRTDGPSVAAVLPPADEPAAHVAAVEPASRRWVLRLAPKQSPPV